MCRNISIHTHVYSCPRLMSDIFLNCSPSYLLRQLNPELTYTLDSGDPNSLIYGAISPSWAFAWGLPWSNSVRESRFRAGRFWLATQGAQTTHTRKKSSREPLLIPLIQD